jgi:hypothetical protein
MHFQKRRYTGKPERGGPVYHGAYSEALEDHLVRSLDDRTIVKEVSTLIEQVELHVENYYCHSAKNIPHEEAGVQLPTFDSSYLPSPLNVLLKDHRSTIPALKHTLVRLILDSISVASDPEKTYLPREFVLIHNKIGSRSERLRDPG